MGWGIALNNIDEYDPCYTGQLVRVLRTQGAWWIEDKDGQVYRLREVR